jgi:hypothetical protein
LVFPYQYHPTAAPHSLMYHRGLDNGTLSGPVSQRQSHPIATIKNLQCPQLHIIIIVIQIIKINLKNLDGVETAFANWRHTNWKMMMIIIIMKQLGLSHYLNVKINF